MPHAPRAYVWLLRAYPAEFREEYGAEMEETFAERYEEEPRGPRLRLWMETVADVLATAVQERYRMTLRDLKHSGRRLARQPGIAATAILSLALGIGANTAIFSIVYATLLKPLPYPDVDRRVIVFNTNLSSRSGSSREFVTVLDFLDWRAQSKTLEDFHLFTFKNATTATGGPAPERITNQTVTPGLLDSLGVVPVLGRLFRQGEEADRPALIGEGYWRRSFGGRDDVLGKKLVVGGQVNTIVGVVPSSFDLFDTPGGVDFWSPAHLASPVWHSRKVPWLMATAKLRRGVTIEQAQSEMSSIAAGLANAYPDTNRFRGLVLTPIHEARNGWLGRLLYPLFGAVALVLLIACTNVANLLLARASARRRELSVRAAIGAGRGRLARELLADGIVLSLPGIAAGVALAYAALAVFRAVVPQAYSSLTTVELSLPALWFTAGAGLLAGLISAALPAMEGSRADLTEALKEGARGSSGGGRQIVRSVLVAAQLALALVLLVGAGLMINTIARMQALALGFDPANVLLAELHISGERYMKMAPPRGIDMRYVEPATPQLVDHVLREVRALPGVESAAVTADVPMGPSSGTGAQFSIAGRGSPADAPRLTRYTVVSSGFFETLRISLKRGRFIADQDGISAPWVAVVNEAFAREYFPGQDPVGQTITVAAGPEERPREIVGVVADFAQSSPRIPPGPQMYTSHLQQTREIPGNFQGARFRLKILLRSPVMRTIKAETISKIVAAFDPNQLVFGVQPLEEVVGMRDAMHRFYARILGLFSGIALALAAVGIFGLMHYSVTDRFHEIGIRVTLGASRRRIVWLIGAYGLKVALCGLAAGIAGALAATRLIEGMLFGVKPSDPLTFAVVAVFLLTVAMGACVLPALRATRVDPVVALRGK